MEFPKTATLDQFLRSAKAEELGIQNVPTPAHKKALHALAWKVFHPLREHFGVPLRISSGYRAKALNAKTKGASVTSQHALGEAMDLVSMDPSVTNAQLFHYIREHLPFDQLIWEYGTDEEPQWIHVSYSETRQRKRLLVTTGTPKDPSYAPWKP